MENTTTAATIAALLQRPENVILGRNQRSALLAVAALSDGDLISPNGLDTISARRVAVVVGLAPTTVDRILREIVVNHPFLLEVVVQWAGVRHHYHGNDSSRLSRGARVIGYRLSEAVLRGEI